MQVCTGAVGAEDPKKDSGQIGVVNCKSLLEADRKPSQDVFVLSLAGDSPRFALPR